MDFRLPEFEISERARTSGERTDHYKFQKFLRSDSRMRAVFNNKP